MIYKRLRRKVSSNLYQTDSRQIYVDTEIYDTLGRTVFESKSNGDVPWHCYKYAYDSAGRLIEKEGYSSGNIGIRTSYQYVGKKLVKETIVQPTGTVVREY